MLSLEKEVLVNWNNSRGPIVVRMDAGQTASSTHQEDAVAELGPGDSVKGGAVWVW